MQADGNVQGHRNGLHCRLSGECRAAGLLEHIMAAQAKYLGYDVVARRAGSEGSHIRRERFSWGGGIMAAIHLWGAHCQLAPWPFAA